MASALTEELERTLQVCRDLLGAEHPDTVRAMISLIAALAIEGEFDRARPIQDEVFHACHEMLDAGRANALPLTLTAMSGVAATLHAKGALVQARDILDQVLPLSRQLLGEDHPDTLRVANNLGVVLQALDDLPSARRLAEQGYEAVRNRFGPDHPNTLKAKANLAITLGEQGELTAASTLLTEAHDASRGLLGDDHPDTLQVTTNLARTMVSLGQIAEARGFFEQAVESGRRTLGEEHPLTLDAKTGLAEVLGTQGELSAARALEEQALRSSRNGLGSEHPETLMRVNNLAGTLLAQGDLATAQTLLEEALPISRRVLGASHNETLQLATNLAGVLQGRGELSRARALREEAIRGGALSTRGDATYALNLKSLEADFLEAEGNLVGARALREEVLQGCLEVLSDKHWLTITAMNNLAKIRYELGDLERAHELQELVLEADQSLFGEDHPRTLTDMNNLAMSLQTQGNLREARALQEHVLESRRRVLGDNHPDTLAAHHNLAQTLREQGDLKGACIHFGEVLESSRRVLGASHPDTLRAMTNLGVAEQEDGQLESARSLQEQALDACRTTLGSNHWDTSMAMNNLAVTLKLLDGPSDLDVAIDLLRECIAATGADQPRRAGYLYNFGDALGRRHERDGHRRDLNEAIQCFREAARILVAPPRVRFRAARAWGVVAAFGNEWHEATEGLSLAISLLPRLAGRQLWRTDQERQLSEFPGLVSEAAACALHCNDPLRAIELVEQGRGVLLAQALQSRSDLTDLHGRAPELAERFEQLRDQLDTDDSAVSSAFADRGGLGAYSNRALEGRPHLARELDRLIDQIRALPDFQRFLMPPSREDLISEAAHGPIVIINVSNYRSDALVLSANGVSAVPLPAVTVEVFVERVTGFLAALKTLQNSDTGVDERRKEARSLLDTLSWLWDAVTEPVLDHLGIAGRSDANEPWPRIWWSPTGFMNLLPLHAAGHHDRRNEEPPPTVMDRVVSSYTPTIWALHHVRTRKPVPGREHQRLVVAMPETPDHQDLEGALREVEILRRLPRTTSLVGRDATREEILARLPSVAWAHFACHAQADGGDPSSGHLLVHGQPLTVLDISRLRLDQAELAFLSACETARGGDALPDEAIHVASAFQLAGFVHVVGTLWPIDDDTAVDIAGEIYTALSKDTGGGARAVLGAAAALHSAVVKLRERYPLEASLWASHIHAGP